MNYRHAYHAGNFADVVKHIVFALCIAHLKKKDAPFRVLDTHAGIGRYRLDLGEAAKTGEWRSGIGRLIGPGLPAISGPDATILGPYLDAVRALNAGDALTLYPGSPLLAQALLRSGDLVAATGTDSDEQSLRIDRSSMERWAVAGGSCGGPLTPRNAWARRA